MAQNGSTLAEAFNADLKFAIYFQRTTGCNS